MGIDRQYLIYKLPEMRRKWVFMRFVGLDRDLAEVFGESEVLEKKKGCQNLTTFFVTSARLEPATF